MEFQHIIVEKKDGIAKIVLNRPQVLNAMNLQMLSELVVALEEADRDEDVRVIVLTGAGRAFSAGRDMKEVGTTDFRPGRRAYETIENLKKPVIAAVNGYCYTGAVELVLCCDMIVASEGAIFGDTHARYGLVHGGGGTQRLPRLLGLMKAKELMLTCEPITAQEAERIGLVNKVVPADKLEEAVEDLARKIMNNSSTSIATIKSLANQSARLDLAAGLELERAAYQAHREKGLAEDSQERLRAFLGRNRG